MKKLLIPTVLTLTLAACGQTPVTGPDNGNGDTLKPLNELSGQVYTYGLDAKEGIKPIPYSGSVRDVSVVAITESVISPIQPVFMGQVSTDGKLDIQLKNVDLDPYLNNFSPKRIEKVMRTGWDGWNHTCEEDLKVDIQDSRMAIAKVRMDALTPMLGFQNDKFFSDAGSLIKTPSMLIYSEKPNSITGTMVCKYNGLIIKGKTTSNFNINLVEGWNAIESDVSVNNTDITTNVRTVPQPKVWLALTLK